MSDPKGSQSRRNGVGPSSAPMPTTAATTAASPATTSSPSSSPSPLGPIQIQSSLDPSTLNGAEQVVRVPQVHHCHLWCPSHILLCFVFTILRSLTNITSACRLDSQATKDMYELLHHLPKVHEASSYEEGTHHDEHYSSTVEHKHRPTRQWIPRITHDPKGSQSRRGGVGPSSASMPTSAATMAAFSATTSSTSSSRSPLGLILVQLLFL